MRSRWDRRALAIGVALCGLYLGIAALTSRTVALRPMYDAPCPVTACPPCAPTCASPTFTGYSPVPYSPQPSSNPTHPSTAPPGASPPPRTPGARTPTPQGSATAGSSPSPTAQVEGTAIGAKGGLLSSPNGEIMIVVPPGAVPGDTLFVVRSLDAGAPPVPPGRRSVSHVWDLYASRGATVSTFNKPLTLVFHYPGDAPLLIAFWDGAEWINFDTVVDRAARTATATTSHFTPVEAMAEAPVAAQALPPAPSSPYVPAVLVLVSFAIVGAVTVLARTRLRVVADAPPEPPLEPAPPVVPETALSAAESVEASPPPAPRKTARRTRSARKPVTARTSATGKKAPAAGSAPATKKKVAPPSKRTSKTPRKAK